MLLFTYEEETIIISNAGPFAAFDSSVGHGEIIAHGYTVAFMLGESWRKLVEFFRVKPLITTLLSRSSSHHGSLFPFWSSRGHHTN